MKQPRDGIGVMGRSPGGGGRVGDGRPRVHAAGGERPHGRADERLFAADGILAVGDVANFHWTSAGRDEQIRIEHWQVAVDHATQASASILHGDAAAPLDLLPYFWSDVWGKKIQVLGHPTGTDEATVVIEPDEAGKFLALYANGETLTGVLAVSKPAQLMGYRALLAAGATIDEARALGA